MEGMIASFLHEIDFVALELWLKLVSNIVVNAGFIVLLFHHYSQKGELNISERVELIVAVGFSFTTIFVPMWVCYMGRDSMIFYLLFKNIYKQ